MPGVEEGRGGAILAAGSAPSWIAASAAMTVEAAMTKCLVGGGGAEGCRELRKGAVDGGLEEETAGCDEIPCRHCGEGRNPEKSGREPGIPL